MPPRNLYDEEIRRQENIDYSKSVMGDNSDIRDNPQKLAVELQKRLLKSQLPKWMGIASFLLLIMSIVISLWALLHSYNIF